MGLDIVNPPPSLLFVPTTIVFEASTTWVVPPGTSKIYAQHWGGGGGGGGASVGNFCLPGRAGAPGGAGEYTASTLATIIGESLTITVGAKGLAGPPETDGTDGGQSSIKRGATILSSANGGIHGGSCQNPVPGAGGTGGIGTETIQGGPSGGASPKGGAGGNPPIAQGGGGAAGLDGAIGRVVIMFWQPP